MRKKLIAVLLAATMAMQPVSAVGAAEFTDGEVVSEEVTSEESDGKMFGSEEIFVDDEEVACAYVEGETNQPVQIGDNVYVKFEETSGKSGTEITATIYGTGATWDYLDDGYESVYGEKINPFLHKSISKVEIQTGITDIGNKLFANSNIQEIIISEGVKTIGDYTFSYIWPLKQIVLPESLTELGEGAFESCEQLKQVVHKGTIEVIPARAFMWCGCLEEFDFSGVKEIGNRAFEDDSIEIDFPNTLEKIGVSSFLRNNQIQSLTIPASVQDIGASAFASCTNLQNVNIPNNELKLVDTFKYCINLQTVSIPESIIELNKTFSGCTRLRNATIYGKQINIPNCGIDNVESVFYGCTRLAYISGYSCSTTKKCYNSLSDEQKQKITFVTIDEGETVTHEWNTGEIIKYPTPTENGIKKYTCEICGETSDEVLSNKDFPVVTDIKWEWNNHNSVKISFTSNNDFLDYNTKWVIKGSEEPDFEVGGIYESWGGRCSVDVTGLPEDEVDIYLCVQDNHQNKKKILILPDYTLRPMKEAATIKIGSNAYATVSGDTMTISGSGAAYDAGIDWSAINQNEIKKIIFESDCEITYLGDDSFSGFTSVEEIILSDSLEEIGWSVFANCSSLQSLELPNSIKKIGSWAFMRCNSLETIKLPTGLTSMGYSVFDGCTSLSTLKLPASLKTIPSLGGAEFGNGITSVTIPEGVQNIEDYAFSGCSNLTNIVLPSSIESIGSHAFTGTGITRFTWPDNLHSIPNGVFSDTKLVEFSVPETVTDINYDAFANCSNLTKISIPNSVTYFGNDVFRNCRNLTIYGKRDSAAERYANNNNIPFISADYKVIFKDNGRTQKTEYVNAGENATPPTLSPKDGYTLSWDGDYTNIQEDMIINAVWTKKDSSNTNPPIIVYPPETTKYTVTFVDRGKTIKTEKVESGKAADYPFVYRYGYDLSWDKDFSNVTSNMTVNAVWTVIKPEKVTSLTAEILSKSIRLSWNETEYTSYYLLYRKASTDKDYKQIAKTANVLYTDKSVKAGIEYQYKVVAVRFVENQQHKGDESDIVSGKVGSPQVGEIYTVGKLNYKVMTNKEVRVTGLAKAVASLTIPLSVSISGKSFKVTSIDHKAFYKNEDLINVKIGNNVTYIGQYSFYQCPNLESVRFGSRVQNISTCAFTQCPELGDVTLPASVERLGAKAFYQCTNMNVMVINSSNLNYIGKKGLAINSKATIKVPSNKYSSYKKMITDSVIYKGTKIVKM